MIAFVALTLILGILIFGGAFVMSLAIKPPRSIPEICEEVVRRELPKIAQQVVADLWRTSPQFRFIKWTQQRLQEVDASLSDKDTFNIAKRAIRQHLADEKIEFGDPRYTWDRDGAREVAQAYEIDHWESVA